MTSSAAHCARYAFLITLLAAVGCYAPVTESFEAGGTTVHLVTVGTSTSFVLEGEQGVVLIDAMTAQDGELLDQGLRALDFVPGQIDTLFVTHGHFDHAGGARELQERWGMDVAVHKGDVHLLKAGNSGESRIVAPEGYLIQAISDFTYPPVTPDVVITGSGPLDELGVAGHIQQVPGHTDGHMIIRLPTGEAFTGDLFRTNGDQPVTHMFTDDLHGDYAHIRGLLDGGVTRLYPAHGQPVDAAIVRAWLDSVGG
jgi:hydroxyacylglutathione hydrolase